MECAMSLGRLLPALIDPTILLPLVAVVLLAPEVKPARSRLVTAGIGNQVIFRHWTFDPEYVQVWATNGWPAAKNCYGVWPAGDFPFHNVYQVRRWD